MQDNSKLSVLVIDPSPALRGSLQNMLNQLNITKIEFAVSSGTAIKQLMKRSYDIILCEYDLGSGTEDGQDGQQLLEDLRHHRIIGLWTIFIMITSEAVYSKVVSAAELTPTDYILKPFAVDILSQRITRAIDRRSAFLPVYQLIGQGNVRAAIRACAAAEVSTPRYAIEFARLRAELHVSLGELREAEKVYEGIIEVRPLGWAQLGLARTLFAQERHDEARQLLSRLIADNPRLMAAYDLLARCHETAGDPEAAQMVLEDAVSISPHMIRRLRHLGAVAMEAGDVAAAEKSFKQVVAKARYSEFRDPEDHVNLTRALVKKGDTNGATAVIRDLEKSLRGNTNVDACKAISMALVHEAAGNSEGAVAELTNAISAMKLAQNLSSGFKINLARTCLDHKLDNEAEQVMLEALNDDGVTTAQAMNVFVKAGRPELAETMTSQLKRQVAQLLNVAAEKSKMGDVKGAVQTLTEALRKAPGNTQVMAAAVQAIVRQIDELGWDHALAEVSTQQLDKLRATDGASSEYTKLSDSFNAAKRKYGIAT
ncbi:response regulator [Massilia arenosa]|uniref:Response regulator n=1 Tax=Zemynaea arenosa TaxID=2561931 RepID=A0A4Y9RQW0_9BURK|nr:tetratricopeptide repeat-containing response regulator [Massilia arenosa]TFW11490.1 response regulator [Massilia arenosa]